MSGRILKGYRRMKEGKNRMQIRPDFERMPAHEEKEDKPGS